MPSFSAWVEDLFVDNVADANRSSHTTNEAVVAVPELEQHMLTNNTAATIYDDAIKSFIGSHFSYLGMLSEIFPGRPPYQLKLSENSFTEDQMKQYIQLLRRYKYDGQLHFDDAEITNESFFDYCKKMVLQNLYPQAFLFQLLNVVEVTAILSAIWEKDRQYSPFDVTVGNGFLYAYLFFAAVATIFNNHRYASIISGMSSEDIKRLLEDIETKREALETELKEIDENTASTLLGLMTRPTLSSRAATEAAAWASYLVKLTAASALFLELFQGLPTAVILGAAGLAGTNEGANAAFINAVAIGGDHSAIAQFQRGVIPCMNAMDRTFLFSRLANMAVIRWSVSKVGPSIWTAVKFDAALKALNLAGVDTSKIPGGMLGYQLSALFFAMNVACAFSLYNIDRQMGVFEYSHKKNIKSVLKALLGAVPLAALSAYVTHMVGGDYMRCAQVGVPVEFVTAAAIFASKQFAHGYRQVAEMRVISSAMKKLDGLHLYDKAILAVTSILAAGAGVYWDKSYVAGPAEASGVILLTALIAEYSRSAANAARFVPAQMFLYAAAMLTWVLNCAISMYYLARHEDPAHRPTHVGSDYFSLAGHIALSIAALGAGALAGNKDRASTAMKVPDLAGELTDSERHATSYVGTAVVRVWNACLDRVKACCEKAPEVDNEPTSPVI